MTEVPQIIDLGKIVEPHLNGGKLISYTSRYLTKPGENYGSIMLAITTNVERADGQIEELPLIAKLPPLTNDLYWSIFQPERTCITENAVYQYLGPAIIEMQLEAGVTEENLFDCLPRYYGSRISLSREATKVDRDAVLVQENLQTSGYKPGNRNKMYDLSHAKLILEVMAKYHALSIALRLKKPELYNTKIRPYFHKFNMNTGIGEEGKKDLDDQVIQDMLVATNGEPNLMERLKECMRLNEEYMNADDPIDDKYTTLTHCDLWINNLMVLYDENGLPQKVKIVDFQIAQYGSLVHDLVFFLLSSVSSNVLEEHYNDLLQVYFKTFLQCLQSVGLDTAEYTYDSFLDEIIRVAPTEIHHAIFMTKVILAENSSIPDDFKDVNFDIFKKQVGPSAITNRIGDIIRLSQKFKFL